MKKNLNSTLAATIVLLAAISCQENSVEMQPSVAESHEVVFETAEPDTKTAIEVSGKTASATWDNTPASYIHLFEDGKEGSNPKINVSKNGKSATFSATFSGLFNLGPTYNAVIASDYRNGVATVPSVQEPAAASFDPAADILISAETSLSGRSNLPVRLKFARAVAITRLTLTGMKSGEKVEAIDIECGNVVAGPLNRIVNCKFSGYAEDGSKKITLLFDSNNTVGSDGKFTTYFVSEAVAPGTFAVTVATDKSLYAKAAPADKVSGLKFSFDSLGDIQISMDECILPEKRFELVDRAPASWEGTYVFVNTDKAGNAKAFKASASGSGYAADVTVKNLAGHLYIEYNSNTEALAWNVSNSGKKNGSTTLWNVTRGSSGLNSGSIRYLYDNNGITIDNNNHTGILSWTYYYHVFNYDKGVNMATYNGSKSTYLGWSGSKYAYTSNSDSRVYLFKYSGASRESQILAYDQDIVHWALADGRYEIGKTYEGQPFSASSKYQPELLSFTSSDPSVATVSQEGNITIRKEGTVTITATAASDTQFGGAEASYQIVISRPYYERVSSVSEITSGSKYIIVSRTSGLLTSSYHAFDATVKGSYNYDISSLFSSLVYDNGRHIRSTAELDARQVVIENGLFSTVAKWAGLNGTYTIKPVSVDKYLYCDMGASSILTATLPLATYSIAFSDANLSGLSLTNIAKWFNQIATIPHNITFDENAKAHIRSATSNNTYIGADLFYDKLSKRYSYVNMTMFDSFDSIDDLLAYYGQNTEYAWLLNLIKLLGDNISISDIVSYFSADMYLYKYVE